MENTVSAASASTWGKAILLWLLTNTIGAFACLALITAVNAFRLSSDQVLVAALIAVFASLGSLPVIPVAFFAFRPLLAVPARGQRLLATGLAVAALCVLTWFGLFVVMGTAPFMALYMGGWVYLPAALLSVAIVYRQDLFRADVTLLNSAALPGAHD